MPLSRVQPTDYLELLSKKASAVGELLAPFKPPPPQIYPSPPAGFRQRAEFRMWHDSDAVVNYVMFRGDAPRTPVVISDFPIASSHIQRLMPVLLSQLNAKSTLRRKLFQIEFLASLGGDLVVTLVYHRRLDQAWENAAQLLLTELQSDFPAISVIGRSRNQKLVLGKDFIQEVLRIYGKDYRYRQYEQSFSQPNAQVNIRMIEWVCEQASILQGDILELYCGNGNFTVPMAQHFDSVIATEISKSSIRAARVNLEENRIKNVHLLRLSSEEVTQAINAEREFRRLSTLPKPLKQYNLGTLLVDPPRAGLDDHTTAMASRFPNVIYVSCNPQSLAQNLQVLQPSHEITQFALFDQFPYTDHMECGVLLQRR